MVGEELHESCAELARGRMGASQSACDLVAAVVRMEKEQIPATGATPMNYWRSGCVLLLWLLLAILAFALCRCVSSLPGCLVAWLPGCLAAWLPGCLPMSLYHPVGLIAGSSA